MATYPLTAPDTGIARISIIARTAVAISSSPFTYTQQVVRHQGEMLEMDVRLPRLSRDKAEDWIGFLLMLRGQFGTFLLGDPSAKTPRGSASITPGSPIVNGAGQTGDILNVSGLPVSATGYLLAGDYIQLGSAATATLHKVLSNVNSDGAGLASIEVFPKLRTAPVDASVVVVANTVGNWRLASNETEWSVDEATTFGITFGAIESI